MRCLIKKDTQIIPFNRVTIVSYGHRNSNYATIDVSKDVNTMSDIALIAYAYDQTVRIYASTTTELVETARLIHQTWPTATAAFGRFLTVSAMMGLMYKKGERLTLRIKGDGPIGSMTVEALPDGEVRGDISHPAVYLKYDDSSLSHKLNVGGAVGKGFLHVTKDLQMKEYFTSSCELQTGEIGDDFTYYFATSEQTPSSVGLGVLVDTDQSVRAAGGYILQLMPGVTESTISRIEAIIKNLKPVSTMIDEGMTPEDMITLLSDGTGKVIESHPVSYTCHCSKHGFARSLSALDEKTLAVLIEEDGEAQVVCHFCHRQYHFSKDELEKIKNARKR